MSVKDAANYTRVITASVHELQVSMPLFWMIEQRGFASCSLLTTSVPSWSPVQQPDPNQPRPEGAEMMLVRGEALGVVTNWPPSLEAALQRWGTISPKAPCLTSLDTAGKPLYVLTYGNQTLLMLIYSTESWTVLWSQNSGFSCC